MLTSATDELSWQMLPERRKIQIPIVQEKINRTQNTTLRCSKCGKNIRIPSTVWFPVCKMNLSSSADFFRLFKEANQ